MEDKRKTTLMTIQVSPATRASRGCRTSFANSSGAAPKSKWPANRGGRALGSGSIVDPHGYIVTNDHVIDKADRSYLKLSWNVSLLSIASGNSIEMVRI
jgi:S1-C subfamily serine protease